MDADTLYSTLLLAAFGVAFAGAALGILGLNSGTEKSAKLSGSLPALLFVALATGAASLFVHALIGHGARSAEPMTGGIFLAEHVAFSVLACLILVGTVTWAIGRRRR